MSLRPIDLDSTEHSTYPPAVVILHRRAAASRHNADDADQRAEQFEENARLARQSAAELRKYAAYLEDAATAIVEKELSPK